MKLEIIPQHRLTGHRDCLYTCVFENSEHWLTAGGDGFIARWSLTEPGNATLAARLENSIYSMLMFPDSSHLLAGTNKGGLHLLDLASQQELHLYQKNQQPIFDLAWMNQTLFSAHGDGYLRRWSITQKTALILTAEFSLCEAPVRCIKAAPDEQTMAAGCSDGSIRLMDAHGRMIHRLQGHSNSVFSLLWLAQGKYLVSGSRDAYLAIWEVASGNLLERIPAHLFTINHLLYLPELHVVASAGRDKSIKLWDATTMELLKVADYEKFPGQAHSHSVNKLLWHGARRSLISVGDDRKVIVWQVSRTNGAV
jgi:WD repeat-containing protein 61